MFTWAFAYPFDTLKSLAQARDVGKERIPMSKLTRQIIKCYGITYLYKGIHVQMLRAFPSGACSLVAYEQLKEHLTARSYKDF